MHRDAALSEVAFVTGAAHGIGRAIAERLAADGCHVIAADPDAAQLDANAADWAARGLRIAGAVLDVRDRAGVARVLDAADRIDIAVNNAGVGSPMTALTDLTVAEIERVMSINFVGAFVVAQEAARRMTAGGRIVNIASRGYLGGAGAAHYVASKAAVVGMTRAMAVELRWAGINVNAVAPGMVETRALGGFDDAMRAKLAALEPSGAAADPRAIADVVAFLASPVARFVNGQVLLADGGKTLGWPPL